MMIRFTQHAAGGDAASDVCVQASPPDEVTAHCAPMQFDDAASGFDSWRLFAVEGVGGAGPANRCDEALSAGEDFDQLIHRGGATDALRCPIEPAREPDRRARLGEGVLAVDVD